MQFPFSKIIMGLALGLSLSIGLPQPARANITITPMAVMIEGRDRYADVNLINTGDEITTYQMGWQFYRMLEGTGNYELVTTPVGDFDLSKHMVFTPRQVTLQPRETQKIRLALRLQGEPPPPGDYRVHLEFKKVKNQAELALQAQQLAAKEAAAAADAGKEGEKKRLEVGIGVNVSFSIPVIYRVGDSDVTATIGEVKTQINPKSGKIEAFIPIIRSGGNFGLPGHLIVYYKPAGGEETMVSEVKNANVFPEVNTRVFQRPLNTPTLSGGTLRIVYKDSGKDKNIVFAEKTVPIGQ